MNLSSDAEPTGNADPKTSAPRKIRVQGDCTICRTCEFLAPTLFEVPEKSLSSVTLKDAPENERELDELKQAIRECPVHIISYKTHKM